MKIGDQRRTPRHAPSPQDDIEDAGFPSGGSGAAVVSPAARGVDSTAQQDSAPNNTTSVPGEISHTQPQPQLYTSSTSTRTITTTPPPPSSSPPPPPTAATATATESYSRTALIRELNTTYSALVQHVLYLRLSLRTSRAKLIEEIETLRWFCEEAERLGLGAHPTVAETSALVRLLLTADGRLAVGSGE